MLVVIIATVFVFTSSNMWLSGQKIDHFANINLLFLRLDFMLQVIRFDREKKLMVSLWL